MNTNLPHYILLFFVLVLVQVLILNSVHIFGYATPHLYIWFIILLPYATPRYLTLFLGFLLGSILDLMSSTPGIHAFATTMAAGVSLLTLPYFMPHEDERDRIHVIPSMKSLGIGVFVKYAVLIVFVHHFALYAIEAFSFHHFLYLIFRTVVSTILTLLLILSLEYFKMKR